MDKEIESKISKLYSLKNPVIFVKEVKEGYLSQNCILSDTKDKFFLKQYSTGYSINNLKEIHKVKFFFGNRDIPVILPYRINNKESIFKYNNKYYTLFPYVEGIMLSREKLTKNENLNLGRLLAQVHLLSQKGIPFSIGSKIGKWSTDGFLQKSKIILQKIECIKQKTKFDKLAYESINLKIKIVKGNRLLTEDIGLRNDHLLHGDFHEKNVFFNENGSIKYLFDWEKTCVGPRSFEVARALNLICLDGKYSKKHVENANLFLKGYIDVYPMEKEEFLKGMTYYFVKKAHSLWIEGEHYINNSNRVDVFLERELEMLKYYSKYLDILVEKIFESVTRRVCH